MLRSRVLVVGMDYFLPKNLHQVEEMSLQGYRFDFFVMSIKKSATHFPYSQENQLHALAPSIVKRFTSLFSFVFRKKKEIHHAELYPGGRGAFVYALILRLFFVKIITVERGDVSEWDKASWGLKLSMRICYLLSTCIWFREPHMEEALRKIGSFRMTYIPNAVNVRPCKKHMRGIDFIWLNRVIESRNPMWYVESLQDQCFARTSNYMLGFIPEVEESKAFKQQIEALNHNNLQLGDFGDYINLLCESRFFILPARLSFGNYGLLEAMSFGVVPIVIQAPNIERLITNGVNGFISKPDKHSYKETMRKALEISEDEWQKISRAAIATIGSKYNREVYAGGLKKLYKNIQLVKLEKVELDDR